MNFHPPSGDGVDCREEGRICKSKTFPITIMFTRISNASIPSFMVAEDDGAKDLLEKQHEGSIKLKIAINTLQSLRTFSQFQLICAFVDKSI